MQNITFLKIWFIIQVWSIVIQNSVTNSGLPGISQINFQGNITGINRMWVNNTTSLH
jgi:hypothetical protein